MGVTSPQKKLFNFYYDLICQKLTVYAGTPANEIISTLRELLQIDSGKKLEYIDEEGYPIVVSSALPNEIKIYVKIKKTFTERFIESQNENKENKISDNSIEWFWLESQDPKICKRKNNNKTIYQPPNQHNLKCKGSLIITSGEYYYTIIFEPLKCCLSVSIFNAEDEEVYSNYRNDDDERKIEWINLWGLPIDRIIGPFNHFGFYVNMDKKLVVIYDVSAEKEVKRFNFNKNWKKISPIVFFKHEIYITISSNAIEGKPDFITL